MQMRARLCPINASRHIGVPFFDSNLAESKQNFVWPHTTLEAKLL
jgi:hypothetical protein